MTVPWWWLVGDAVVCLALGFALGATMAANLARRVCEDRLRLMALGEKDRLETVAADLRREFSARLLAAQGASMAAHTPGHEGPDHAVAEALSVVRARTDPGREAPAAGREEG